jgi:CBS domain-containing protein
MKVKDLMHYPIRTVQPDATVMDLLKAMSAEKKDTVLIAREGLLKKCEGIVTKSQIYLRVFGSDQDPENLKVSEIMTPQPLVTINPNASCKEAAELMRKYNIRRLPVVEDGVFVGIITCLDLLRCVE